MIYMEGMYCVDEKQKMMATPSMLYTSTSCLLERLVRFPLFMSGVKKSQQSKPNVATSLSRRQPRKAIDEGVSDVPESAVVAQGSARTCLGTKVCKSSLDCNPEVTCHFLTGPIWLFCFCGIMETDSRSQKDI